MIFWKFFTYFKFRSIIFLFISSFTWDLMGNSGKPNFDVLVKRSFLSYFYSKFFIHLSLLPTKIASCLRAMLACSGTLSYPDSCCPCPCLPELYKRPPLIYVNYALWFRFSTQNVFFSRGKNIFSKQLDY